MIVISRSQFNQIEITNRTRSPKASSAFQVAFMPGLVLWPRQARTWRGGRGVLHQSREPSTIHPTQDPPEGTATVHGISAQPQHPGWCRDSQSQQDMEQQGEDRTRGIHSSTRNPAYWKDQKDDLSTWRPQWWWPPSEWKHCVHWRCPPASPASHTSDLGLSLSWYLQWKFEEIWEHYDQTTNSISCPSQTQNQEEIQAPPWYDLCQIMALY